MHLEVFTERDGKFQSRDKNCKEGKKLRTFLSFLGYSVLFKRGLWKFFTTYPEKLWFRIILLTLYASKHVSGSLKITFKK